MLNTSFSPWPSFTKEEAEAVQKVLLSNQVNYWTGTQGREFEKEFAKWCGTQHAVAVANGTVALDLALKAIEVEKGDEVIVTSRTFLASVSSIVNAGAIPVFVDVCKDSQNITPELVRAKVSKKTKAVICVHLAGWPCEMDGMMELADEFGLFIIEDCAQAHGAKYKEQSVGSIGHIGAWSFCQDKIMTTGGEGGMVTTNNQKLWSKMWSYKDHGKSWDSVYTKVHPEGFRWLHDSFGTNWRITEMQSAIGRIQLSKMTEWHFIRLKYANMIWKTAKGIKGLRVPDIPKHIEHAAYKCYVFVEPKYLKEDWNRDLIISKINSHGVPCYSGSCSEVYLEKAFDKTNYKPKEPLCMARELGQTALMFLVHPTLKEAEIIQTCNALKEVFSAAQK